MRLVVMAQAGDDCLVKTRERRQDSQPQDAANKNIKSFPHVKAQDPTKHYMAAICSATKVAVQCQHNRFSHTSQAATRQGPLLALPRPAQAAHPHMQSKVQQDYALLQVQSPTKHTRAHTSYCPC